MWESERRSKFREYINDECLQAIQIIDLSQ